VASTVPANGDVNPYGVAVVRQDVGSLHRGDTLVSNFNAASNEQGTGTTIVDVSPTGAMRLFAHINPKTIPGGVGLTTALTVLPGGWVVVGSLPTKDGTAATATAGELIVLNADGHVVETWSGGLINGPWDSTAVPSFDGATLFVTNVLNGTVAAGGQVVHQGTVIRLDVDLRGPMPRVEHTTLVGNGFAERTDPAALVVGPTGVGVGLFGTLYVADTASNRIAAIPGALWRRSPSDQGITVSSGGALNNPLGLTIAPDGHVLTVNAGDGNLVELTPFGTQVATRTLDTSGMPAGAGALFGLAIAPNHGGVLFVDDATNTLNLLSGPNTEAPEHEPFFGGFFNRR
jgi:sugar lactone lactonase YvrE